MRRATALSLFVILLTFLAAPVVRAGEPRFFTDVATSQWYTASVRKLWDLGIVGGNSGDLRFRPNDPITRAEFVKMLILSDGLIPVGTACTGAFADVPCNHWAALYVELAHRLAIADGVAEGWFDPGGLVTREQLVTMLQRALGRGLAVVPDAAAAVGRFADAGAVHGWARPAMALAVKEGVLKGTPAGNLEPDRQASRAEAAALLERAVLPHYQRATATTVDSHNLGYYRLLTMRVTAYAGDEPGMGAYSAVGLHTRQGMVAVDPSVIPLGTLLYVEGYGYGVASDTGSAIKGMRIDIFVASAAQADYYGIQTRRVYIIEPAPPAGAGG